MKLQTILLSALFYLFFFSSSLLAFAGKIDTCTVNDRCVMAIPIQGVVADQAFVCIEGCNVGATPELFNNACHIGEFPTVWYSVFTEGGTLMNIQVSSSDFESPVITLFQVLTDCNDLVQIPMTANNYPCVVGSNGAAEAFGTDIGSNIMYMIAVSSLNSIGGAFTLCVNTISITSPCVTDRNITIEARSAGGDLSGPFYPGETVSVCMNVNSYSAAGNGCQWFQGLVPVFGNGWDSGSFDPNGQPLNATINGNPMDVPSNGLYGSATWDWFSDVDYHFDDPLRQVGDFDGNGIIEMCSIAYDPDCPDVGGLNGSCCNPCWGNPLGTILPPGWFAYGINGSCAQPGPPVRVDWGDGNSCGGPMGPWRFCFDLMVRLYPDCLEDDTSRDLTLGFFTFADGETGAWTGAASVCAFDQPIKITFPFACGQVLDLGTEILEDRCANSIFDYIIDEPDIDNWTWSIFPFWAVKNSPKEGDNGYAIHDTLVNPMSEPVEVTYFFTGYEMGASNVVIKQVRFRVIPEIQSTLPEVMYLCEKDKDTLTISAEPLSGGLAPFQFLWNPGGETTSWITVLPPFQSSSYSLNIVDSIGCTYQQQIKLKVSPCHLDTIMPDDESNDPYTFEDPPILIGKQSKPGPDISPIAYTNTLKIFPQPTTDLINIEWPDNIEDAIEIIIFDTRGSMVYRSALTDGVRLDHRLQVDIGHFAGGVFVVVLQTRESILTGKMVKI